MLLFSVHTLPRSYSSRHRLRRVFQRPFTTSVPTLVLVLPISASLPSSPHPFLLSLTQCPCRRVKKFITATCLFLTSLFLISVFLLCVLPIMHPSCHLSFLQYPLPSPIGVSIRLSLLSCSCHPSSSYRTLASSRSVLSRATRLTTIVFAVSACKVTVVLLSEFKLQSRYPRRFPTSPFAHFRTQKIPDIQQ